MHANEVMEMMPDTVTRFKVIPMSGVFLDHQNAEGKDVFTSQMKNVFEMQNCTGGVDQRCLAAIPPEERHKCMFAQYTMQYVKAPMFMIGSAYDKWATTCILGAEPIASAAGGEGNCSAVPGWTACEKESGILHI